MADTMFNEKPEAKNEKGTVTYKCEVTCYWNERLYRAENEYELPSNSNPPKEYFKKL